MIDVGSAGCSFYRLVALVLAGALGMSSPATGQNVDAASSGGEQGEHFDILEYRVLGTSVLAAREVERAVYPHLGPDRDFKAVEAARVALETAYREHGFGTVFVDVPEQEVVDGVVRLRVTEGRLDRVRISGARYFANGQIREALPALNRGAVPDLRQLQTQLATLNRVTPDRAVTPVLRAGRMPGTVDIELKVQDELPLHASVEVNDRYTAETSRTRVNLNLSYDNLFQRYHRLALQYQTAPEEEEEAQVLAATYVAPLPRSRNLVAVYAVDTDSEVATIGTLGVLGKGRIYGARYIAVLPDGSGYFHNLSLGGDWKDFTEDVLLADEEGLQTPIEYLNWSATYSGNVRTRNTSTGFNLGANLGIRGLGNDPLEFENKRFKAPPNYFYLRAAAEHERPLFFGTRLGMRLAGQYTVEPLISNEQFAIGGADSVRGYLESEELGDYGVSGSIEFRVPAPWWKESIERLFLFSFIDAGVIRIIDSLPGQPSHVDLSSWGFGLRFAWFGGLEAELDWASPLVPTENAAAGDSRIHFRIRQGF